MSVNAIARGIFTAAVGIAVGSGVILGVGTGRTAESGQGGQIGRVESAKPAPSPGLSSDGAAGDAARLSGWAVIAPGTPAARYWGRHGVGVSDPYKLCEGALRVQYVRGYASPGADDSHRPLWKPACVDVPDATRDSITVAAVEWGVNHAEGDG